MNGGAVSSFKSFAFNPDGTKRRAFATGERIHSSAAVSTSGTIYFASNNGQGYALNRGGTLEW